MSVYVAEGEVVAGKYRVERVLGLGGMAFVLSAKHVQLEEHFALKFINQEFLAHEAIVERFTREAKAACKIRSEHVARVYDVGVHEGAPFLVMEHLVGRDLAAVVAANGALTVADAAELAMQACVALAVAHSHGIVHRDIKPENLFLVDHDGLPMLKLLDFGISKVALIGGDASSRLTGKLTLGTPSYMAPEQIRSTASADARSDLWSLGAVLYELLSGREAFQADTITGVCAAVLEQEPRPLGDLRPDLPPELVAVVTRCMQKDPEQRFANVAELAAALLPFAPSRALVSVERSSSILRAASASESGAHAVAPAFADVDVASSRNLASAAPLSRSIQPSQVDVRGSATPPPSRRWRGIALVASAVAIVLLPLTVLAFRAGAAAEPSIRDGAVASAPPPQAQADEPSVTTTVATHALPVVEAPRAQPSATEAPPAPRAAAVVHSAKPISADAGAAPSATAGATPSSTVELGY